MTDPSVRATVDRLWSSALQTNGAAAAPPRADLPFSLAGGHSLAAARLVAGIRSALGRRVSIVELLRTDPTPDQVAAMVDAAPVDDQPGPDTAVTAAARTYARARLPRSAQPVWAFHRLHPESPAYNVLRVVTVAGRLEPRAMRAAAATLADRHDALRCTVTETRPGRPEFVAQPEVTPAVGVQVVQVEPGPGDPPGPVDWQTWAPAPVEAAIRAAADRPFDMATAPLWRLHVVYVPQLRRSWLLLACHHLVADLRSSDVLLGDLATGYDRARAGDTAAPSTAASLVALHASEAGRDATPEAEAARAADLEWWARALGDRAEAGPLPLAVAPDADAGYTGDAATAAVDPDAVERLARLARVTTAAVLLAASSAVFGAWRGGDSPAVVGIPSARSVGLDDRDPVGFLVDTVPMRAAVDAGRTFGEVCRDVRDAYLDALDHTAASVGDVMARLAIPRRSTRSTLIDLWFNDLQQARCPATVGGEPAVEYDLVPSWSLFLAGLYVRRGAAGVRLHAVVPRDTMTAADLAAFVTQIADLVTRAAARPDAVLADLLTPPRDPAPEPALTTAESTLDRLGRIAAARPDAVAVRAPGQDVTFAELAERARAAASRWDVRCRVALGARHDVEHIVNLLGVVASGASVALVDDAWPVERQRAALELSGATHTCGIDDDVLAGVRLTEPRDGLGGVALQFTSGTTGSPLTVVTSNAVRLACIEDLGHWLGVTADDRASFLSGAAHDPSWRDLGLPLRAGASVCVPPDAVHADPSRLLSWLRESRVTVVSATPALLGLALDGAEHGALPDLRLLVVGGAPLTLTLTQRLREVAPTATVVNGYGCTETPQLLTALRLEPGDPLPPAPELPVGSPLPGRGAEVRTAAGRPCDVGQLGTVWAGAPHIADGYLTPDDSRDVADRFVTDRRGRRWFDTGDLARVDAHGRIELAGRADRQRLINGHRIVLDDVEAVARAHPDVGEAVAVVVQHGSADALRMFVRPVDGAEVAESELRETLRSQLPAAAVPTRIIVTDEMTVSSSLKPVAPTGPVAATAPAAPVPPVRVAPAVTALAEAILGRPLAATDNFFEAGFDSLTLLQFSAELSDLLQREVPAIMMFRYASLHRLLARLSVETTLARTPASAPRERSGGREVGSPVRDRRRELRRSIANRLTEGS